MGSPDLQRRRRYRAFLRCNGSSTLEAARTADGVVAAAQMDLQLGRSGGADAIREALSSYPRAKVGRGRDGGEWRRWVRARSASGGEGEC